MRVAQLWRYPVKSMQGESLPSAEVDERGLVGDRRWAILDLATGNGLTARREPHLLLATGCWHDDGSVSIRLPDGHETADDAALSGWLGRDVALRDAADMERPPVYESPTDAGDESAPWAVWRGPMGTFHDSSRTQVSLCSATTIAQFAPLDEVRRFRFNVVLDGAGEDDLLGQTITLGGLTLDVTKQIDRCVMVTRPQPDGIRRDLTVLKRINAERASLLGIGALVRSPGPLAIGDQLAPSG
ncbi:MAG: MOSC N-terminal beta barrel domain-containing protein [Acidimicrobiia bacterium]|nr:MOSC N-terminal beta barrel domain-containing protein [Acidimicrobiia bacterium]